MTIPLLNKLFQGTGNNKLRHELLLLLHNQGETANRLISLEKRKTPGRPEQWYLEKVIYDLKRH